MGLKVSSLAAILAMGQPPLRFASANNFFPSLTQSISVGNGGSQGSQAQQCDYVITQDFTSLTIGFTTQILKALSGVSNLGNGVAFQEFAAVYNGIVANVTLGGSMPVTVADVQNAFFDALPASAFSVAKFSKGTKIQLRCRVSTSAVSTDLFPKIGSGSTMWGTNAAAYYYDTQMATLTTGVYSTANLAYAVNSYSATGATASGTTVTMTFASTTGIVSGKTYKMSGATGSGNALFYNCTAVVTVVNSTTITYTAPGGAPTATATGTLVCAAQNGIDAKFGNPIPFLLLAPHTAPAFGMLGDSKTFGTGDTATSSGLQGMNRLLFTDVNTLTTAFAGGCNFGCPSGVAADAYSVVASGNLALFEAWYAYMTYGVVGYGTNAAVTANQSTLWSHLRAKGVSKLIQRSLTPRTVPTVTTTALSTSAGTVTITVPSSFITNLGLTTGQTFTGVVAGMVPSGYNTAATGVTMTVQSTTTVSYTNATTGTATTFGTLSDCWETSGNQIVQTGYGVGSAADTFETYCQTATSSDANLTFYRSQAERLSGTVSTANYWIWKSNGTAFGYTADGLHESATGYEANVGTAGLITTQAGGTVSQSLRAYMATLP